MRQLTREEAIAFGKSKAWEKMDYGQRARFQIAQELICMPVSVLHEAIQKTLGRSVFLHELAMNLDGIKAELNGTGSAPTIEEIINMIAPEKLIVCLTKPT